jgi:thioesterase domain-containing protein
MALSHVGCDVAAVCPSRGHPLLKTSSVPATFPYSALHPLGSLATAIRAFEPHILVPCDDRGVQHLHELYAAGPDMFGKDFSTLIQRSLGPPASYPIVSNRLRLLEMASNLGLRVPETSAIHSVADLERTGPPWVLKADGTWGGHGVRIANDFPHAAQSCAALKRPLSAARAVKRLLIDRDAFWLRTWWKRAEPNVIAQTYISGRPANCAVCCWKGKVLAAIYVEVIQAQGATGSASIVRLINHPEMALAAKRIARRLELSGFFGLDFVIQDLSGAAYLIEMNPRCTPLCHLRLGAGKDMVAALRAQLAGQPLRGTPPSTRNKTIAYFPQAWHWDRERKFLMESSFQDVPWEEPELVQELLRLPWPDRGILAKVSKRLRGIPAASRLSKTVAPSVIPIRHTPKRAALFLIHGVDGKVGRFHKLVKHLDPRLSVYGIQAQALVGDRIALTRVEDMAAYYLKEVRALQPRGPYHFLGYSFGGLIAFEMARQMHSWGEPIGIVGLIDNRQMATGANGPLSVSSHLAAILGPNKLRYIKSKLRARALRNIYSLLDAISGRIPAFLQSPSDINWFAARRYVPGFYPGQVTLFQTNVSQTNMSQTNMSQTMQAPNDWTQLAGQGTDLRRIPGDHENLFDEPQVQFLAKEISACLSGFYSRLKTISHAALPLANDVLVGS